MSKILNDNHRPADVACAPDAHGQAAYLLIESLIHALVAETVVTRMAAIEVVEIAREVRSEIVYDLGDTPGTMERSLALLEGLARSLATDHAF